MHVGRSAQLLRPALQARRACVINVVFRFGIAFVRLTRIITLRRSAGVACEMRPCSSLCSAPFTVHCFSRPKMLSRNVLRNVAQASRSVRPALISNGADLTVLWVSSSGTAGLTFRHLLSPPFSAFLAPRSYLHPTPSEHPAVLFTSRLSLVAFPISPTHLFVETGPILRLCFRLDDCPGRSHQCLRLAEELEGTCSYARRVAETGQIRFRACIVFDEGLGKRREGRACEG